MIEEEYKEIQLKSIGKNIGWILLAILLFLFYEGMAREFSFFDEFSLFFMLLVIAIRQNAHFKPPLSEE
jgi:hypothetical protein